MSSFLGAREYRDSIVLIGGWVPYFILEEKKQEHVGSLDVDLALDFRTISDQTYSTILQILNKRGYEQSEEQPFIFYRSIRMEDEREIRVEIDLLSGEYGGTSTTHRTQSVQDVRVRKARGCDLAFRNYIKIKLLGKMPDGSGNMVTIKVATVVSFLAMKGMVLWTRFKEKDAYDIYFTILNYPGGFEELAKEFEPHIDNKLVREGLGKIKTKFSDVNATGPIWVSIFEEISDTEEKERLTRDVFERVNTFLDILKIEPFKEE
jgi:hypothetical protein